MAALGAARAQGPRTADHARLGVFIGKWNVAGERAQPGRPLRRHPQWCLGPRRLLPRYALQRHRQWATGQPDRFVRLGRRQQALHVRLFQQPLAARQFHRLRRGRNVDLVGGEDGGRTRLLMRLVQHFTADGTLTWKIETSTDGTHWATAVTGQAKRAP